MILSRDISVSSIWHEIENKTHLHALIRNIELNVWSKKHSSYQLYT